ncbi:hypothetical protein LCGC14_2008360 [marine sediment metagenome]|uniref:DUF5659 domain-containing protein n=1 Tax=marine sediment metagenome TaxID=412755 RepID=A0A0F9F174_9ZZZZ
MSKEASIEENPPTEFRTDQTPIAAYLITEGFTLLDTEKNARGFTEFIFQNDNKYIAEYARKFELDEAMVSAASYIRNYQDLIKRIKRGW